MGYSAKGLPPRRRGDGALKTEKGYQRGRGRGTQGGGEVRIIGALRGQRVPQPLAQASVLPQGGAGLFNWLREDLQDARVLDVFAGSGALGLEALSRGAAAVTFIERIAGPPWCSAPPLSASGRAHHTSERDALTVLEKTAFPNPLTWCSSTPLRHPLAQAALTALAAGALLAPGAKVWKCPRAPSSPYPRLISYAKPKRGKCCPARALEALPVTPETVEARL